MYVILYSYQTLEMEAMNCLTIQRNNGTLKKKDLWRNVMTVLRNTDFTEQVLEHWESIADVPLICCIPISRI